MTRIIGGQAGSLRLVVPKSSTRPTSDRVREAWFSRIDATRSLHGASVLDVFAGSGALGLEAASRGASSITLVDNDQKAIGVLKHNADTVSQACTPPPRIRVVKSAALSFLEKNTADTWDVVFIDPPYDYSSHSLTTLLHALVARVNPGGLVGVERSVRSQAVEWPAGFDALTPKTYGETILYSAEKS